MKRVTILALACSLSATAQAQNLPLDAPSPFPNFGSETQLQFQWDNTHLPDGTTTNNLTFTGEHQTVLELSKQFWISNLLSWTQIDPPPDGTTTAFQNEGLYAEELYGRWTNDIFALQAGKFSQSFGRAWYLVPGVYGNGFVSDYQLAEMWGGQASVSASMGKLGQHTLTVSDFMVDRSPLAGSLFYGRPVPQLSDGGPANTQLPQSYVVSYNGDNIPLHGTLLSYQASYAYLAQGQGDSGTEQRYALGVNLNIPIDTGVESTLAGKFQGLRLIGEAVRRTDANGVAGQQMDYLTAAAEYVRGNWFYDLSATWRNTSLSGDVTQDSLYTASVGYNFPFDTSLALAIAQQQQSGVQSLWIGTQLTYTFTQCDRCLITAKHY